LMEALERAGHGELPPPTPSREANLARPSPFTFAPAVAIDNDASQHATVIEASGRDRPGLVEALARAISEADLSIQSAHIDNYGERAVDAFYVVTAEGAKLTNGAGVASLRARLTELLEAGGAASAASRLQKARASSAR
jgi:[protein-PII] uridylyltransferase